MESTAVITKVEFSVENKLVVADPCYIDRNDSITDDHIEGGIIFDNCSGEWVAEIESGEVAGWGIRVAKLSSRRKNFGASHFTVQKTENWVDSGQMYMGCLSNLPLDYETILNAYKNEDGKFENHDILAVEGGVVSGTGFGDGCYPVLVGYDSQNNIVEVTVDFLGENEE